uniref:Uncharacterized protein n=1 Tax=Parascaris univalens TaxID=6257 RepID=A0A915BWV1_PARUN
MFFEEVGAQSSNMSSDMSNVASTSDATMTTSDSTTSESATTSTITSNTNMSANITSPKLLFGRSVQVNVIHLRVITAEYRNMTWRVVASGNDH